MIRLAGWPRRTITNARTVIEYDPRASSEKLAQPPFISTGEREGAAPGTPKAGGYALGWGLVQESWAAAPAITHNGSNTMNLATAMFWPGTDFRFVMITNIGGKPGDEALRKLAAKLHKQFNGK
jgi:hypothetical protein